MTIKQTLERELAEHEATTQAILDTAERENRSDLTAREIQSFDVALREAKAVRARLAEIDELDERDAEREAVARVNQPAASHPVAAMSFGTEARTYRRDGEHSFFTDLVNEARGDRDAAERLRRHHHETRAVDSGGLGQGLVPPQFLSEQFAGVQQAGLVLANLAASIPLPPQGLTLTVPLGVTATLVSGQSGENTTVANRDLTASDLSVPINTYAGHVDVSIQSIERGAAVDQLIYADLIRSHNASIEADVIAGPGDQGRHLGLLQSGVLSVTCTSTLFTTVRNNVIDAAQRIASNHLDSATAIVVHPRRWAFWETAVDGSDRPQISADAAAMNASGVQTAPAAQGAVGTLAGFPVYLSPAIPLTVSNLDPTGGDEDIVIVTRASDLVFSRDDVLRFRFDEPLSASLGSRLVVRSYSAWTAQRYPNASAVVHGTGLNAPVF